MNKNLKILLLEDLQSDAELIIRQLKKGNIACETLVVSDKESFVVALTEFSPDLILSDHTLPAFNSLEALKILLERKIKVPFILCTGTMSEEFAAKVMKEGAWDYVQKDQLDRLPEAVNNAMAKFQHDRQRQKFLYDSILNEAYMEEAERIAHYGSWEIDMVNGKFKLSKEAHSILGYSAGETET